MHLKQHEKRCIEKFNKSFAEIHEELDKYAVQFRPFHNHRRILHHLQGVQLIVEKFGEEARAAAILHIEDDGLIKNGQVIKDWDDWDWVFFGSPKQIAEQLAEQAALLKELFGDLYTSTTL